MVHMSWTSVKLKACLFLFCDTADVQHTLQTRSRLFSKGRASSVGLLLLLPVVFLLVLMLY